jgi:hypothetical protein
LLDWARNATKVEHATTTVEWDYGEHNGNRIYDLGLLDIGKFDGFSIRVYIDDEIYEWGGFEPTDDDRSNLEVIGVAVRIDGDDEDLDAIWSVGYLDGDMHKIALETAVSYGFLDRANTELSERARLAGYVETCNE